ncbi:MAG: ribosome maturation factor RimM [Hyphomicrobiales bacterium]|jgi:16S rRNA processing protein RimM|nr:ribosome maturation factor RimM [Hyphomicrobiales bacterium]
MPATLVLLGRFGRAHGVKGEVRLQSFTADPHAIAHYNPLTTADGARLFKLTSVKPAKDMLIARVAGVEGREAAEALNGIALFAPRERLPTPTEDDEFLMADLIGCAVVLSDGSTFGTVVDVPNYGAGDLIDIKPAKGGASVLLPFTKTFVPAVDISARHVVIDPPAGLFDV